MTPNDIAAEMLREAVEEFCPKKHPHPIAMQPSDEFLSKCDIAKTEFVFGEKPYRPLVNIRHYGQNSHWSGRGQR